MSFSSELPRMTADVLELQPTQDPGRWAAACEASGQPVHPFLSYSFLDTVAPMAFAAFRPLIVRQRGADVGVLPWMVRRRGPFSVVNQLPFPYTGPLVPPGLVTSTLRSARRRGLLTGAIKQSFQFAPGVQVCEEQVGTLGFEHTTDSTYVVDVAGDRERLWGALNPKARNKIRGAHRTGVVISDCADAVRTLGDVVSSVCQDKCIESGYRSPLELPHERLNRLGLDVHWTSPILDGQRLGSLITLRYGNSAATWLGGILPQHRTTNAGVLMFWDAICWANANGATTLDLVGLPDAGIDQFKRQFGGQKQEYLSLFRGTEYVEAARTIAVQARRRSVGLARLRDSAATMSMSGPRT